jgi:hypothetical protein
MAYRPGTLLMKSRNQVDAKMTMNVMDGDIVNKVDGAKALQDIQRINIIYTMKLQLEENALKECLIQIGLIEIIIVMVTENVLLVYAMEKLDE